MMLAHLGHAEAAAAVERAFASVLAAGRNLTPDMGGKGTTQAMGEAVAQAVEGA
jgi:tartrate dehydrogenase/decarboxylase/D-malate dehydrogenase